MTKSLINLGLRGTALAAKFLLIIYLGKVLSLETFGEYGIFITSVAFSILIIGLDFYTFANKEIIFNHSKKKVIMNQIAFNLFSYLLIIPIALICASIDFISYDYIFYFILLVLLEHISQDLYRTLTALKKPIFANVVFFIRNGAWVFILIIYWSFFTNKYTLFDLYKLWIFGAVVSIILGFYKINKDISLKFEFNIDKKWILKGVKLSLYFFGATLSYKFIELSDRYLIDYFIDKSATGVYIFHSHLANVINILIFTVVFMIEYPLLFEDIKNNDHVSENKRISKMYLHVIGYSLGLFIIFYFGIDHLLLFMGKEAFSDHINIFYIKYLASFVFNISLIAHFILYAHNKTLTIFYSSFIAALFNLLANIILIPNFGITGAAISTLLSIFIILLLKFINLPKKGK